MFADLETRSASTGWLTTPKQAVLCYLKVNWGLLAYGHDFFFFSFCAAFLILIQPFPCFHD